MRGLTLLCLFGLIVVASALWPTRGQIPMEGEFNSTNTTNTSMVQRERQNHTATVWVGTREPVDNDDGFPPPPDGDDTQGKTNQ